MELFCQELPYNQIESIVMSDEHPDSHKINFYLLDIFAPDCYSKRLQLIESIYRQNILIGAKLPRTQYCQDADSLFAFFRSIEEEQGEGICFRLGDSPYKEGRSTLDEQYLVKLSRYVRAEAKIIGFTEQLYNGNKKRVSALGLTERSDRGVHMFNKGTLGSFIVQSENPCIRCDGYGELISVNPPPYIVCPDCKGTKRMTFSIGTGVGLTEALRQKIWDNQSEYFRKIITYKCKQHGRKIKPRHPTMVGFRNERDI
jgi:ATP-dependent DNA ligase